MTKLSIIVPVYNVENYLKKCLDSIINQSLKDIEIICVNDGSKDASLKILLEYSQKDSRISIITQKNKGLGGARDTGLAVASGEYIGFVDSDDWIDKDYFEKLYLAAKNSGADIARTSYIYEYMDGSSEKEKHMSLMIDNCIKQNTLLGVNEHSVVCWNAVYRTQFLRKNNIDFNGVRRYEDVPFTAKVTFSANFSVPVSGEGYHYRRGRAGVLSEFSESSVFSVVAVNNLVIDFINSLDCAVDDYLVAFQRCVWRMDYNFQSALKFKRFNTRQQKKVFKSFCNMYEKCAYLTEYKAKYSYKYLECLEKKDFKSYISLYKKIERENFKPFSIDIQDNHKIINILGVKIKLRLKTKG